MQSAEYWIKNYQLLPHPEGGHYREIYSASTEVSAECLQANYAGKRKLATSIYFLLAASERSKLHKLASDELWYFHYGASLEITIITPDGQLEKKMLGPEVQHKETFQVIIPAGSIFGAEVKKKDSYTLVGCMVTPGFTFEDFEMPERQELLDQYPSFTRDIIRLT